MNILYYINGIDRSNGGVFQYSLRVLAALVDTEHVIYVFGYDIEPSFQALCAEHKNLHLIKVDRPGLIGRTILKLKRTFNLLHQEWRAIPNFDLKEIPNSLLEKLKVDLVHSPSQYLPRSNAETLFTLHDVQELHFPEYFSPKERAARATQNAGACSLATGVIVSYEHIRQDLLKYFGLEKKDVHVLFIGSSDEQLPIKADSAEISSDFLLYPAATWPHKNHETLFRALKTAKDRYPAMKDIRLVCTGHLYEPTAQRLSELISELGLEDSIEMRGLVENAELKHLYSQTLGVVIPTRYEAGSFPLMESMIQGIPVICSNVTSLPDTIGSDEFVFDDMNIERLAEKLNSLCSDMDFRIRNVENSMALRNKLLGTHLSKELNQIYLHYR